MQKPIPRGNLKRPYDGLSSSSGNATKENGVNPSFRGWFDEGKEVLGLGRNEDQLISDHG